MHREEKSQLLDSCHLYGILDTGYVPLENLQSTAKEMCQAGIKVLQFRAKTYDPAEILPLASSIKKICERHQCLFAVNDFPNIAAQVKADILHIGQGDGELESVKRIVGTEMLIGRSTHCHSQACQALQDGFDYIGFGPLFPTPTKKGRPAIGIEEVGQVQTEVGSQIPVFCIGGIKLGNLDQVTAAGATRVVIVSDILQAENRGPHIDEILRRLDKVS